MNTFFSNKILSYLVIASTIIFLNNCDFLDPLSIFSSSEVDYRFDENKKLSSIDSPIVGLDFRFLVISDTHYNDNDFKYFNKIENIRNSLNIDFIIINGDITQAGTKEQYNLVNNDMKRINIPIFKVLGNHDIYNKGYEQFKRVFGRSNYFLKINKTLIIVLDTANGIIGNKQKKWLENTLASNKSENIIIFSHYSPFDFIMQSFTAMPYPEETYYITKICEKYNVDYFISGHLHKYDERLVGVTNYLIVSNIASDDYDSIILYIKDNKVSLEKIKNLL